MQIKSDARKRVTHARVAQPQQHGAGHRQLHIAGRNGAADHRRDDIRHGERAAGRAADGGDAVAKHGDAVGDRADLVEPVADEENRAPLRADAAQRRE